MVLKFGDEWRMEHVLRSDTPGPHSVRAVVRRHLDKIFFDSLDAMLGIRRRYGDIELLKFDKERPETVIEVILSRYREPLEKKLIERLQGSIKLTEREEKHLRAVFRREVIDKVEEKLRDYADDAAEKIIHRELRHIWMDKELSELVEDAMEKETG